MSISTGDWRFRNYLYWPRIHLWSKSAFIIRFNPFSNIFNQIHNFLFVISFHFRLLWFLLSTAIDDIQYFVKVLHWGFKNILIIGKWGYFWLMGFFRFFLLLFRFLLSVLHFGLFIHFIWNSLKFIHFSNIFVLFLWVILVRNLHYSLCIFLVS